MAIPETIQTGRRLIRPFVQTFSDQKLAEVYAFNADGKMQVHDRCSCIRGVFLSEHLHKGFYYGGDVCNEMHFSLACSLEARNAEVGYAKLGLVIVSEELFWNNDAARLRLSSILRAEMRRRDSAKQDVDLQAQVELVEAPVTA